MHRISVKSTFFSLVIGAVVFWSGKSLSSRVIYMNILSEIFLSKLSLECWCNIPKIYRKLDFDQYAKNRFSLIPWPFFLYRSKQSKYLQGVLVYHLRSVLFSKRAEQNGRDVKSRWCRNVATSASRSLSVIAAWQEISVEKILHDVFHKTIVAKFCHRTQLIFRTIAIGSAKATFAMESMEAQKLVPKSQSYWKMFAADRNHPIQIICAVIHIQKKIC